MVSPGAPLSARQVAALVARLNASPPQIGSGCAGYPDELPDHQEFAP
jgi:hypothetical protein